MLGRYDCSMSAGSSELIAYCAGVLDSDGHIGVHVNWYKVRHLGGAKQPTYQPRCSVKQLDPEAIEVFHDLFAGHCYVDTNNARGSARPINVWQVHSAACRRVLESLRPFLRVKARQADLVLELCDLNQSPRSRTFVVPEVVPGESMVSLAEAAERAGRSYATAIQSVKISNIPFERRPRQRRGDPIIFVPESYIETWRTRSRGAMRRPEVTDRMAAIADAVKALNSGKRGQEFRTPRRLTA